MNDKDNLVNGYPPGAQGYPGGAYMSYSNGINAQTSYGININSSISTPPVNPIMNYAQPGTQGLYMPMTPRFQMQPKAMNYAQTNPLHALLNEGRSHVHQVPNSTVNGHHLTHTANLQHQRLMSMHQQPRQMGHSAYGTTKSYTRPTYREDAEPWSILDMSGANLRSLCPQLFQYSFLTTLFLSNNNLSYIPAEICRLKTLNKLDVSSNVITSLPPELGLLVNLKELLLYENSIVQLPIELGTLYRLETLGLDGNPINEEIMKMLATDGAPAVICFLRDTPYSGEEPPPRYWESYEKGDKDDFEKIKVMSYNILSDKYATPQQYGYTPSWALDWGYRRSRILSEIIDHNPDIICLQEIEAGQFEAFFKPELKKKDYEGVFWCKSRARLMNDKEKLGVDGCATFYRPSKFTLGESRVIEFGSVIDRPEFGKTRDTLNRLMNRDNVAGIVTLERADKKYKLLVANAHVHWHPEFADVKLIQTAMLAKELEKIVEQHNKKNTGSKLPVLLCGDFNSLPQSGVFSFLDSGDVPLDHPELKDRDYGDFCKSGLSHNLMLKSAYKGINFTNFTPTFTGVIDYIWYTQHSLTVTHTLGPVDPHYASKYVGFPNAHFPSDHISLLIEVKIKAKSKPSTTPNFTTYMPSRNNLNSPSQLKELTGNGPSTQAFNQKKTNKVIRSNTNVSPSPNMGGSK